MKIGHVNNWRPEVGSLLKRLVNAGITIIHATNGEDLTYPKGPSLVPLVDTLTATDEGAVRVKLPDGEFRSLFLVLGNSPGELVSDYGVHPLLDTVTEAHFAEWDGKAQPTKFCKFAMERHEFNERARIASQRYATRA